MTLSLVIRVAAVAFALLALTIAGFERDRGARRMPHPPPPTAQARPGDSEAATLARCQALGEAGARDESCLAAWARNRQRFLGAARDEAR